MQLAPISSFESICLSIQDRKLKIDFQNGSRGGHLGFPIGTILAIFDLQFAPILPVKFRVNWPFRSREEIKKNTFKMAAVAAILDFRSERF